MSYIDIPSKATFTRLRETKADVCVSIYLPSTPVTAEVGAVKIEYNNYVSEALKQAAELVDKRRLAELEDLLKSVSEDDEFWAYQGSSLAVLATPERLYTFRLANNLKPIVEVADRFLLKPLLRAITFPHMANILVLSENNVRFIEMTNDLDPRELKVPDMPSGAAGDQNQGDRQPARLTKYARRVDEALKRYLRNSELPLILIASEQMSAPFRSVYSGNDLIGEITSGSMERATLDEITEAARPVLDRYYERQIADIRGEFDRLTAEGRTTTDISLAARAATYGQISTLLADMDEIEHGTIDDDGVVHFGKEGPDTYGIVDEIASRVLAHGGQVLAVRKGDIPQKAPLAAIFRFAV